MNVETWSDDVFCISQHEGFLRADRPSKPVLVGHSLGAYVCIGTAIRHNNWYRVGGTYQGLCGHLPTFACSYAGLVLLDAALPHPYSFGDEDAARRIAELRARVAPRPHRSHSVSVKPTDRFRLMPTQQVMIPTQSIHVLTQTVSGDILPRTQVRLPFLHEHIANHSVALAVDGKTWTWKFGQRAGTEPITPYQHTNT